MLISPDLLYESARSFLADCLHGKDLPIEGPLPWRSRWEFTYQHSLRVESLVLRLLAMQGEAYNPDDLQALRLAAILHDLGRRDKTPDHAARGAEVVRGWLEQTAIAAQVAQPGMLLNLIARHSRKDRAAANPFQAILNDADLLDEIGAMSIVMNAYHVDATSRRFFSDLLERIRDKELPYCERILAMLNTAAGRAYLLSKRDFIAAFADQLAAELC